MKKLLAMVLALVMTLSLAVSANALKAGEKINEDYAEAVAVLDGMGVFKGYEDGSFKPENKITRAEVATIIYRIYTADVAKNDKSGMYATYNKFSDMAGAGWAAGYIGYCANAEFVKGYPDGTFKPSGNVTGYEVLAMILRAVGYDKNGEFTGADWALNVAKYAEQLGVLDNVEKTTNLGAPATRELVSELLFQSIQVPMVTYTPAFGYVTDKVANIAQNTLAKKNFYLDSKASEDEWGRPSTKWFNTKTAKTYAVVSDTPVATFQEATAQCDICSKLGEKTSAKIVETYTNGVKSTDAVSYKSTATKETVGAQGRQLEYYEVKDGYRLVIVDTYLAYVKSVVTEKLDKNGHVDRDDYLELVAFTGVDANGDATTSTVYVDGNDYAKDEYVLVNINAEKANNVEFVGLKGEQAYVEVAGKADSLDAAQTSIWRNDNQHTIDGKDYDDACKFFQDDAKYTKNVKFTWFFDQFGNVIGSVALDRSSYAVLKDMIWEAGKPGHAEATLVTFDGEATKKTVIVNTIDGFDADDYDWVKGWDNSDPYLKDSKDNFFDDDTAPIGEDEQSSNKLYRSLALYMVETNDDDTVNLQGIDVDEKDNYVTALYTDAVTGARLNIKSSMILFGDNSEYSENDNYVVVTDETQFIVRTGEGTKADPFKYEAFTGTEDLPNMADGTVDLMYNYDEDSNVASYVYISNYTPAELDSHLVFVYQGEYRDSKDKGVYCMDVILDGVKSTIKTSDLQLIKTLSKNVGMLFFVEIETDTRESKYGEVTYLDLVNAETSSVIMTNAFNALGFAYLPGKVSKEGNVVLKTEDAGLYAKDAAVYVWNEETNEKGDYRQIEFKDLAPSDLEDHGIWVTYDQTVLDRAAAIKAIYVGAKLDNKNIFDKGDKVAALSFQYTDSAAKDPTKESTATYYFEVNEDGKFDKLEVSLDATWTVVERSYKLTVTPVNSYIDYEEDEWLADDGGAYLTAINARLVNASGEATVTTEDGVNTYKLEWVVAEKPNENALSSVTVKNNNSNVTLTKEIPTATLTLDDIENADTKPVGATESFTLTANAKDPKAAVKVVSVTELEKATVAEALTATGLTDHITVGMGTALNGGYVVIEVTAQNGDVAYYVFSVVE